MTVMRSSRFCMPFSGWPGRKRWQQVPHFLLLLVWLVGGTPVLGPSLGGEPAPMPHHPVPGDPMFKSTEIRGSLRGAIAVQGGDPAYAALQGLTSLGVVVAPLAPELARYGVTPPQVQREVEERLRQAGLRVVSTDEMETTPGSPAVYLDIYAPRPGYKDTYTYLVRLSLLQHVVLARDPTLQVPAVPTWVIEYLISSSAAKLPEMRADVLDIVERFIMTYQEVTRHHERGREK